MGRDDVQSDLPPKMEDLDMKTMASKCVTTVQEDCTQQLADWDFFKEILEANIGSESIDKMKMSQIWGQMDAENADFGVDTLTEIKGTLKDNLKNLMEVINEPNEDNDDVDAANAAENCCCAA